MAAFALGVVQLSAPEGDAAAPDLGLDAGRADGGLSATSFWIHDLRIWGIWSPIHLLSIFTLVTLPLAVLYARRHRVDRHRWAMIAIFTGALVIAGMFTFVPGRIMHRVVFGELSAGSPRARRTPKSRPEQVLAPASTEAPGFDDNYLNFHLKLARFQRVLRWRAGG